MIIITTEKGQILYDAALVDQADDHLFEPEWWRLHKGLAEATAGRGSAWFLNDGGRGFVLRHYRRGGFVARFVKDSYLWSGREKTRPWREFVLLWKLHGMGLAVPRPVAARIMRRGLIYRGDLITQRLDAHSLFSLARVRDDLPWHDVGACIRRFHDANVYHADLNAHNILVDRENRPYLIDFDRGEIRAKGGWQDANLARLRRSFDKLRREHPDFHFTDAHWAALIRGYSEAG